MDPLPIARLRHTSTTSRWHCTGVTALAHEHARPYLPDELTRQIDQVLGQLRLGQVSAESHASQQGQPEENDLNRTPAPPPTGTAQ